MRAPVSPTSCLQLLSLKRNFEFSEPGTGDAVPRYFRDIRKSEPVDLSKFKMPIRIFMVSMIPRQPIEYCVGMDDYLPGLEAILVLDLGIL